MKITTISFLIFFILTLPKSVAQQQTDSLVFYSELALNPKSPSDLDTAYNYFNHNFNRAQASNSISRQVNALYYMASIDYKKGAYIESEHTAVNALALLDRHTDLVNNTQFKKSFYNLLGMLYYEQRNKNKSLELYEKVLAITENTRDSAIVYNNISNLYKRHDDIEAAKTVLLKAYNLTPRLEDSLTIALISDNLGFLHTLLNEQQEGYNLMTKALHLRELVQDTTSLYNSYAHLAQYYLGLDSLNQAKKNALKALQLSDSINSAIYKHDALGLLTQLSHDSYAKMYKVLNDSITNAEKERASKFALMKYDYAEYQRQALESELAKEKQESKTMMALLVTALVTLLSAFLFYMLRSKHKKEKLQQVYDTESRIAKQIHDDVSNDLFQVMTKLEKTNHIEEALKDELHTLYYRTRDISKEHSLINKEYSFSDYLSELVESFNDANTSVIVKGLSDISWDKIEEIKRTTLYKVLQELLINMKKHSAASIVVLIFKKHDKNIQLSYSDNGMGCDLKKSTGLHNTENRIHAINGTIIFETEKDKGFKVKINV